jgi:hypothetical protein
MRHYTDPFTDDPRFRDPPIVDRHGKPIGLRKWSGEREGSRWTWALLGIAAVLLVIGIVFGPFGGKFRHTGPELAESAPNTIGQGR